MLFSGVYVAVVTPFTESFEVDYEGLRRHVDWLIDEGVHGVVPTGTCGEYASLTFDEREQVVETVLDVAQGRVPVVVGVAAPATAQVVHWAEHARNHGADAIMALPPINYRASWSEIEAHYRAIDAVGLPIVIYNNPYDTGTDITPERFADLERKLQNLAGIKEFSQDIRRVTELQEQVHTTVLAGADDMALESFAAGAAGWIAGMANILPKASVDVYESFARGDTARAWKLYRNMLPLLRYDTGPRLVQAIKYGLEASGRSVGPTRPPRLPLGPEDRAVIERVVNVLVAL